MVQFKIGDIVVVINLKRNQEFNGQKAEVQQHLMVENGQAQDAYEVALLGDGQCVQVLGANLRHVLPEELSDDDEGEEEEEEESDDDVETYADDIVSRRHAVETLFRILDFDNSGSLQSNELFEFAVLCGFEDGPSEWKEEFEALCKMNKLDPKVGFGLDGFDRLLKDEALPSHCPDEELEGMIRQLRAKFPNRAKAAESSETTTEVPFVRKDAIVTIFKYLDRDRDGSLCETEMRVFAGLCDFPGDAREWTKEYRSLCKMWKWKPLKGPSLGDFEKFVNDGSTTAQMTDDELQEMLTELEKMKPGKTEEDAATKIQAKFRGRKSLMAYKKLKLEKEAEKSKEKAIKLQAFFRKRQSIQQVAKIRQNKQNKMAEEKRRIKAATRIQAQVRQKQATIIAAKKRKEKKARDLIAAEAAAKAAEEAEAAKRAEEERQAAELKAEEDRKAAELKAAKRARIKAKRAAEAATRKKAEEEIAKLAAEARAVLAEAEASKLSLPSSPAKSRTQTSAYTSSPGSQHPSTIASQQQSMSVSISSARQATFCSNCGDAFSTDAMFCRSCGTRREEYVPGSASRQRSPDVHEPPEAPWEHETGAQSAQYSHAEVNMKLHAHAGRLTPVTATPASEENMSTASPSSMMEFHDHSLSMDPSFRQQMQQMQPMQPVQQMQMQPMQQMQTPQLMQPVQQVPTSQPMQMQQVQQLQQHTQQPMQPQQQMQTRQQMQLPQQMQPMQMQQMRQDRIPSIPEPDLSMQQVQPMQQMQTQQMQQAQQLRPMQQMRHDRFADVPEPENPMQNMQPLQQMQTQPMQQLQRRQPMQMHHDTIPDAFEQDLRQQMPMETYVGVPSNSGFAANIPAEPVVQSALDDSGLLMPAELPSWQAQSANQLHFRQQQQQQQQYQQQQQHQQQMDYHDQGFAPSPPWMEQDVYSRDQQQFQGGYVTGMQQVPTPRRGLEQQAAWTQPMPSDSMIRVQSPERGRGHSPVRGRSPAPTSPRGPAPVRPNFARMR